MAQQVQSPGNADAATQHLVTDINAAIADLQKQIADLLKQVAAIQKKLGI